MSKIRERAEHYFKQSRYAEAEKEFRAAMGEDPDDSLTRAMLSLCLASQKERHKEKEALSEAKAAIHLAPDFGFTHYALGVAYTRLHKNRKALQAFEEAVRLDPESPDYLAALSEVCFLENRYPEALEYAEQGLQQDAEHIVCNNLRASTLLKLGRRTEADANLQSILSREPENTDTHANLGYAALETGDYKRSFEHFREALRLDPQNDHAREGIITAMKARNPLYRPLLRYFLWMDRFSKGGSILIIIGLVVFVYFIEEIANYIPIIKPFTNFIVIAYVLFAILTWMGESLFNLVLRLDKFGRYCLTPNQIWSSNVVGLLLLFALASAGAAFLLDDYNAAWITLALTSFALTVPLASSFNAWERRGNGRYILLGCTAILIGLAGNATWQAFQIHNISTDIQYFVYGWVAFSWIANIITFRS